jgi:hypothetical protein
MAKRARGTMTRPGQRRPTARPATRPASSTASTVPAKPAPAGSGSLTAEEEARAAQLEAAIVAQERRTEDARRGRSQRATAEPVVRTSSPLATAAASEYAYVARDVRRVARVGGTLVGLLLIAWAVSQVTGVAI